MPKYFFKCKKKQKYQSQKRTHGEFAPVKGTFVFKKTDEQSCLLQHWQAPTATHAFLFLLIHVFTWLWWGLLFHVFKNVLYKMFIRRIFVPVEYVILLHFFLNRNTASSSSTDDLFSISRSNLETLFKQFSEAFC